MLAAAGPVPAVPGSHLVLRPTLAALVLRQVPNDEAGGVMGHTTHKVIVVTSWKEEVLDEAAAEARGLGLVVLGPGEKVLNGFRTFVVCSNGSKTGWPEEQDYSSLMRAFAEYLDVFRYEDDSSCLEWVFLAYGNDDNEATILDQAWLED